MTEMSEYEPGTFCWVDLATTDAEGAKKFYSELMGWETNDVPVGEGMVYTMLHVDGKEVAALYKQDEQQQAQGIPPHWLAYVSVASADEVAEKARSLGGQVLSEPFDVYDSGRMAPIQDPTGAVFAVWQPKQHIGARLVNQPGTMTWTELATNDRETAKEFYTKLFDWDSRTDEMETTTYTTFLNGERMNAGMVQMTEEWGDIPPHWMVYFAVEDTDRDVERIKELGGQILVPPTDIPEIGRFAVVQDPQGAAFSIIKLANPQ